MRPEPTPVLILAHDRAQYLQRTLDTLVANPEFGDRRVIVSQDGSHDGVRSLIASFGSRLERIQFDGAELPWPGNEDGETAAKRKQNHAYMRITGHYKAAFEVLFEELGFRRVIVLEDDLLIADDFFSYIETVSRLMETDASIWTVSAWNDNSYTGRAEDPERLLRTDFFPGLGWIMTSQLWREYRQRWPSAHWDHWFREPRQRAGRSAIIPEVSRTYNIGRIGTSSLEFYDRRLQPMRLNERPVDFAAKDLSYLLEPGYGRALREAVSRARPIEPTALGEHRNCDVKLVYLGEESFNALADQFDLNPDFGSALLPRCSCDGVVSFREGGRMVYLVSVSFIAGAGLAGELAQKLPLIS